MSAIDNSTAFTAELLRLLEGGASGYREAAGALARQGRQDVAVRLRDIADERLQFAQELREAGEDSGARLETGHADAVRTPVWPDLRTALQGNDPEAVVAAALAGEDRTIDEFDRALAYGDVTPEMEPTVRRVVAQLRSARSELAVMAA